MELAEFKKQFKNWKYKVVYRYVDRYWHETTNTMLFDNWDEAYQYAISVNACYSLTFLDIEEIK